MPQMSDIPLWLIDIVYKVVSVAARQSVNGIFTRITKEPAQLQKPRPGIQDGVSRFRYFFLAQPKFHLCA